MSEQQTSDIDYAVPVGQPGDAGGEYAPMTVANPVPKETFDNDATFESDRSGVDKATEELLERRQPTREEIQASRPVERAYFKVGGERHGERVPVHDTITSEQGAHDLTTIRGAERQQELAAVEELIRNEVDGVRGQQTVENLGIKEFNEWADLTPEQVAAKWETLTPEQQEHLRARTEATTAALDAATSNTVQDLLQKNPQLASAMQEEIQRTQQQAQAQIEQERARYIQGLASNAATAIQSVAIAYPELASITDLNQIPVVINTVAQSNPDRAKAMAGHIQQVAGMVQQAQAAQGQYQAQQYAAQQQQFAAWSKAHDDSFERHFDTVVPDRAEQAAIQKEALAMLREDGLSDETIAAMWQTPALRSVASQKAILNAVLYRRAQAAAKQKAVRPIPVVQRPGSGSEYVRHSEWSGQREALARLDKSGSPRDAANYLIAKRAAARRG